MASAQFSSTEAQQRPKPLDLNKNGRVDIYEDSSQSVEARVADLLSQMTVEEKTAQLATLYGYRRVLRDSLPTEGWKSAIWKDGIANIDEHLNGVGSGRRFSRHLIIPFSAHARAINETQRWFIEQTRLGIPVDFSNEALHGLNHSLATPLPAPIGIGSTWNRALVHEAGVIAGREGKALGYTNLYAPILDPARDQRWGRTVETYGEEPFLIAELGKQMVLGIQSQGVASTLKHFAVYSVPKGARDGDARTDPHVAPKELHQIHLYPFRRVIEEAHPMGVMSSYNDWDGEPVTASRYFLTELLRDTYGFDGYVVSDSDAVEFVFDKHRTAADYDDAVRQVLEAGLNVRTNFTMPDRFIEAARRLIAEDKISQETIDRRVGEVLSVKFRLGLFDTPYVADPDAADAIVGVDKTMDFVDRINFESMVLLKNDGDLLPLSRGTRILVTGPMADETNYMTSRYGPNGHKPISILSGLQDYLGADNVLYAKGCDVRDANFPESEVLPFPLTETEEAEIARAVDMAGGADVIVAVLGEDATLTGESMSRTSLELPGRQNALLDALLATGKPVVVVLVNGQPLTVNRAHRDAGAILEAWWPSFRGGYAVARTLFGEYNPGGKLTVTFPRTVGQLKYNFPFKPASHGGQPSWSVNGGGNTRVIGALYPFGHGLSYTTFEYSDITVTADGDGWLVRFLLSNTGTRSGDEVPQLYVRDLVSSVTTYDSVLRGFERIHLTPGETKSVEFRLRPDDLKLLDRNMRWVLEPGDFEIMAGSSSRDIRLKTILSVE